MCYIVGNKIDHVSQMFISKRELMQMWDAK